MSLQTGTELARTNTPVIDPRTLTIVAYSLVGPHLADPAALVRIADVRELGNLGMIVDSVDELILPSDVIAIKTVLDFGFHLEGIAVVSTRGRRLGKVIDFTIDPTSFVIQQLVVRRPLLQSLTDTELLVHRAQIKEVTNRAIIIEQAEHTPTRAATPSAVYVNPFRSTATPPAPSGADNQAD